VTQVAPLDCIAMKDEIQARLAKKWQGLSDGEIRASITHDLETSEDLLALWWRRSQVRENVQEPVRK